jgi:GAF domain-containing protein
VTEERAAGSQDDASDRLGEFAELLSIGQSGVPDPAQLVRLATAAVPHSECACLTVAGADEKLETVACTDENVARLDAVQFEIGEGPGIDVIERSDVFRVRDLDTDMRWPSFGRRALDAGVRSVLGVRITFEAVGRAVLTFYARRPDVFTDLDLEIATVFGSLIGIALQSERYREHAANLEIALESNRQIGTAIGILMARELLTADQAFDRLRDASQRQHRKLREVAEDVTRTGELPPVG